MLYEVITPGHGRRSLAAATVVGDLLHHGGRPVVAHPDRQRDRRTPYRLDSRRNNFV